MKWKKGYSDGSGPEYITIPDNTDIGETAIACVRWGCDCCKTQGPLTPKEKEHIDKICNAVNLHDELVERLVAAKKYICLICPQGCGEHTDTPCGEIDDIESILAKLTPTSIDTRG